MINAIIRIEKNNYYLTINNDSISIILANNNETRVLSKEEAEDLINSLFESILVFKERVNNYDIYIDEVGNKRYFKDNKEDLLMFFKNNGKKYIMYSSLLDNNLNEDDKFFRIFKLKIRKEMVAYLLCSALAINIVNFTTSISEKIHYEDGHFVIDRMITLSDAKKYIYESEGDITEEQRDYFYNDDFITDVLEVADESRNYILRQKLKNINIIYGDDFFDENNAAGYYDLEALNTIHLKDTSEETFNHASAHEFVHLMQDNNQYSYVLEACAEMMSAEYYDRNSCTYPKQRESVCMLMEVIGPKPVMELNFKGDTSTFEKAIKEYLDKEDANTLLELFTKNALEEDFDEVSNQINPLIEKMYFNKYQEKIDINDYNIFRDIQGEKLRCYFNQRKKNFYTEYNRTNTVEAKELTIDDLKNNPNVCNYICHSSKKISKEEFLKKQSNPKESENVYTEYKKEKNIDFDNIYENGAVIDNTFYSIEELEEKGIIKIEYYENINLELKTFDEVEAVDYGYFDVNFKDGGQATFFKDIDDEYSPVHYWKSEKIHFESVAEKFPDQVKDKNRIDIMEMVDKIVEAAEITKDEIISSRRHY